MIKFENTDLGYPSFTALEDFSCTIARGEIVTFFGPSGCGKSTVIKNILGILRPLKGTATIDGNNAADYQKKIAYTPQDNQLLPWLNVRDNITLWQKESLLTGGDKTFEIDKILEMVQLNGRGDAMINELSGGMARRTALGRCMATSSSVMCLDEALVAVERKFRRKVMIGLRNHLKQNDITTVIISHDYEEAVFMSDRVFVLSPSPAVILNVLDINQDFKILKTKRTSDVFESTDFITACKSLIG